MRIDHAMQTALEEARDTHTKRYVYRSDGDYDVSTDATTKNVVCIAQPSGVLVGFGVMYRAVAQVVEARNKPAGGPS